MKGLTRGSGESSPVMMLAQRPSLRAALCTSAVESRAVKELMAHCSEQCAHVHAHVHSNAAAALRAHSTACTLGSPACGTLSEPLPRHVSAQDVEQYSLRHIIGVVARDNLVGAHQCSAAVQRLSGRTSRGGNRVQKPSA